MTDQTSPDLFHRTKPEGTPPCPFCHMGDVMLVYLSSSEQAAFCKSCEARGPIQPTPDAAWQAWSDRGQGRLYLPDHTG